MNIPINKICFRALEIEDLPTKSVVLSSKRILKIFTIAYTDCLISVLIAKGQSCPTSSVY